MRKLFGAVLFIVILITFMALLFGSREHLSDLSAQISHMKHKRTTGKKTSASEPSVQKSDILLVNTWNPLPYGFMPGGLVDLFEYKKRNFDLASSDIQLEKAALKAADSMFAAAKRDNVGGFIITSGYRNKEKQAELYSDNGDGMAAKPGYSEHETGLALDITADKSGKGFDTTPQFYFLIKNCWDYGFILRYPENKEHITGIPYEPWHYRYVGLPHSQIIRDKNITLEEYLY